MPYHNDETLKEGIIMKKMFLCMFIGLTLITPLAFSDGVDFSAQISPVGYMNFNVWTKYNKDTLTDISDKIRELFKEDTFFQDGYNMYTLGTDIRVGLAYLTLNVGFPRRITSNDIKELGKTLEKNSFIFNGQLGCGGTFFKESPVNLFVGGGISFDVIKTTRNILNGVFGSEDRLIAVMGLGLNVGVSFYFLPNIGLFAGVTDNLSFIQLSNQRYYTLGGLTFSFNEKTNEKDIKKMISGLVANNFTARLGIAFKL